MLATLTFAASVHADQSWNFQSYNADGSKGDSGYITVSDEQDGKAKLRFNVANMNACYRNRLLNVTVENTAEEKVITIPPVMATCNTVRFNLKNDGSGGTYSRLEPPDQWIPSAQDRGLQQR